MPIIMNVYNGLDKMGDIFRHLNSIIMRGDRELEKFLGTLHR